MSWIQTHMGIPFRLDCIEANQIDIRDIAHALSLLCRFNGHTSQHYSVAQHCVIGSMIVEREHALTMLLHDAAEAYIGDVSTPVKAIIGDSLESIEEKLLEAICKKYGAEYPFPRAVKNADRVLLHTEARDLLGGRIVNGWTRSLPDPLSDSITPWTADLAEYRYLKRFNELRLDRPMRGLAGADYELRRT